jgi:hypothetical protein
MLLTDTILVSGLETVDEGVQSRLAILEISFRQTCH